MDMDMDMCMYMLHGHGHVHVHVHVHVHAHVHVVQNEQKGLSLQRQACEMVLSISEPVRRLSPVQL